jgi:hypothetical protein
VGGVAVYENAVHVEDYGLGVGHGLEYKGENHRGTEIQRKIEESFCLWRDRVALGGGGAAFGAAVWGEAKVVAAVEAAAALAAAFLAAFV